MATRQLIVEKRILAIPAVPLTLDGDTQYIGRIDVEKRCEFRVGQMVILKSSTQPSITLQIKRIINQDHVSPYDPVGIYLGPADKHIRERTDVSAYRIADGATLEANEQMRPKVPEQEIERATYEEEPVVARRSILVDKCGKHYTVDNPVPVQLSDGTINIGSVNAELEVQLSHLDNFPDVGDIHDSVRIGDGEDLLEINPDGSINVVIQSSADIPVIHKEPNTYIGGAEQTVATFTTTDDNTNVIKIFGEAQTTGTWKIYADTVTAANLFGVTRTSAMHRNAEIHFVQPESIPTAGTKVLVTFTPDSYRVCRMGGLAHSTFTRIEMAK